MSTAIVIAVIVIVIVVVAGALVVMYNNLVRSRNKVDNAWAQVDVQLKRRYDLIPNLVEAVKGYASHERETFEQVVQARTQAVDAKTVEEQGEAENLLTGALRRLFALAEDYPQLRASENFQQLQSQLGETENRIAVSRQIYNDTTLSYNNAVQTVPTNLVASTFGFDTRPFFETEGEERSVPQVDF
jgi:LemA protein